MLIPSGRSQYYAQTLFPNALRVDSRNYIILSTSGVTSMKYVIPGTLRVSLMTYEIPDHHNGVLDEHSFPKCPTGKLDDPQDDWLSPRATLLERELMQRTVGMQFETHERPLH